MRGLSPRRQGSTSQAITAWPGGPARREAAVWPGISLLTTAAVLLILRQLEPFFWFFNDKNNQYLPVARDIGRRLRDGEFPTIDPDLGTGGNYALDLQYGLYEPVHLLSAVWLSTLDNPVLAGFLWAFVYLLVLSLGSTCLAQRLGAPGPWAAAAGVSAATSGYVLYWLAPVWIPGLLSLAWLPWFWWAWAARLSPLRCLLIGLFAYLVVAGGWPATWLMFAALALGLLVEHVVLRDREADGRPWLVSLGIRLTAVVGGLIPAVITVLPLVRAADYTVRADKVMNDNFLVANLADILSFASPTLHGEILGFHDEVFTTSPIYYAAWFGVPVLWLVSWRWSTVKRSGVVSGAVACFVMTLLTQAPSDLGPLHNPIRSLAGVHFFLVIVTVVLASAAPLVMTRMRVIGLAASLTSIAWVTWARDPTDRAVLVGVLAMMALAALFVISVRLRPASGPFLACVGTVVAVIGAFQLNPVRAGDAVSSPSAGNSVQLAAADRPSFASYTKGSAELGFRRLSADLRTAPGYSSIRQVGFDAKFCIHHPAGYTCDSATQRMLEDEPRTGRPWIDLLGYHTVVIAGADRQQVWEDAAGGEWQQVDSGKDIVTYQRSEVPVVAGRITHVEGEAEVREYEVSNASQSYQVATETGATLVFRDLYWPGYSATLDGEQLKVSSLSNTLLQVQLPGGAAGTLTVKYAPVTAGALVGLTAGGGVVVTLSMVGALMWRRRNPSDDKSVDTPEDQDISPAADISVR